MRRCVYCRFMYIPTPFGLYLSWNNCLYNKYCLLPISFNSSQSLGDLFTSFQQKLAKSWFPHFHLKVLKNLWLWKIMSVQRVSMYSFLQNTLAKNSSPLIFCSQKGFLAAREYFPTWFLFTAHPNTLNFILQLDNGRHTNTFNFTLLYIALHWFTMLYIASHCFTFHFTLLYIAPRKYFPTGFPFTSPPKYSAAHTNTFHFTTGQWPSPGWHASNQKLPQVVNVFSTESLDTPISNIDKT